MGIIIIVEQSKVNSMETIYKVVNNNTANELFAGIK